LKKILCLLLCLCMLMPMAGCFGSGAKTTLMIYMVGSDLEAKGGAGTNDMEEILKSNVDLSSNNILIYAGGTKKWHNDNLTAESGHSILQLTQEGFQTLETRTEVSMGAPDTLSYFLNYAHSNYSAEDFALILWDHGNGPLIGYGKDMLHEDDSLTLLEMKEALNSSPFSGEDKLAWVGFDACLMSSVELACIWQQHADYLIASQEIEPSFGWNYSFLQQLSKLDTPNLAGEITKNYMNSCLEYYKKRNYDQRDTTLACMDLSAIDPLKSAIEALFKKATANVQNEYKELVASRVNTRALGRATTGSEYDLIDLADMTEQLKGKYPNEATAVAEAIKKLVVHNVTNTTGCCGLSIYYPFYNKQYYEKAWGDVYRHLDVLPEYLTYLEAYAKQWLKNDLIQTVASSVHPQIMSESQFKLELTDQQEKAYADANYYILQREGDQIYTRIHTSSNVTKNNKSLVANFDGNILYAKNNFDDYWIPVVDEHDTVGDYTRYSTYVNLTNSLPPVGEYPEGYTHQVEGHRFHISLNNKTNEIKTSALVPYDTEVDTTTLTGGKQEDADLSKWSEYYFLQGRHIYLQRDKNGTILPLEKWEKSSFFSANTSRVDDGIEFVCAPIPAGEYYVIFEIEDVQGNKYCSELLPIQSKGGSLPRDFEEKSVEVNWTSGEKVKLFSQSNVTLYLSTLTENESTRYVLQAENKNNFDVAILGYDLMYNNSVYCDDGFGFFSVPAGKTASDNFGIDFGAAEKLNKLTDLKSIQFNISVVTATGDKTLIKKKPVSVSLSSQIAGLRKDPPLDSLLSNLNFYKNTEPIRGMQAGEQVVFEQDGLRATLLALGGKGGDDTHMTLTFRFDNTSSTQKNINIIGIQFDNVFLNDSTGPISVYGNTVVYETYTISQEDLDLHQIRSASSVSLHVMHMQFATLLGGGGFSEAKQYKINLAKQGAAVNFKNGSTLLYQDSAVQIHLQKAYAGEYGGYVWECTMVNKGSKGVMLNSINLTLNGQKVPTDTIGVSVLAPHDTRCTTNTSTAFTVDYTNDVSPSEKLNITFTPQFYDVVGEKILWTGTKTIVLNN